MSGPGIRRVQVWPAGVRWAHWLLVLAFMVLAASGWALAHAPAYREPAEQYHRLAGYLLSLVLLYRLYGLILGRGVSHWRDCVPGGARLRGVWQMMRFYLSWGRSALPGWYAHNPLWGPVYLLVFGLLAVQAATGLAYDEPYRLAGFALPQLHRWGAGALAWFAVAHILAAFIHDWKGGGADVSAMINGHRIFLIEHSSLESGRADDGE